MIFTAQNCFLHVFMRQNQYTQMEISLQQAFDAIKGIILVWFTMK